MIGITTTPLKLVQSFNLHQHINSDSMFGKILKKLPQPSGNKGPWVAGGSVWKAIENIPLDCDIDFFFSSANQLETWLRLMKSIPYDYHVLAEKTNQYNVSFDYHVNDGTINKTIKIQFIHFKYYDSIQELLESFDFTVCQFGIEDGMLYTGDTSFDDLHRREIIFKSVRDARATRIHLDKYLNRGFKVAESQRERYNEIFPTQTNISNINGSPLVGDSIVVGGNAGRSRLSVLEDEDCYPNEPAVAPAPLPVDPVPAPASPMNLYADTITISPSSLWTQQIDPTYIHGNSTRTSTPTHVYECGGGVSNLRQQINRITRHE